MSVQRVLSRDLLKLQLHHLGVVTRQHQSGPKDIGRFGILVMQRGWTGLRLAQHLQLAAYRSLEQRQAKFFIQSTHQLHQAAAMHLMDAGSGPLQPRLALLIV
jgi:hypothetical protein